MIEITSELDLNVIVQVQTLAFLCKNLNYEPQSINQSLSVTCVLVVLILF